MTATHPTGNSPSGISHLIGGIISDITALFRQEIELAKTEAGESVQKAANGGAMIAVGGVLALGALGVFLAGVVVLLGAWLEAIGLDPMMANVLAALIVSVIVGGIAWITVAAGINRLKTANFTLPRTTSTLSADVDAVKERF